MDNPPAQPEHSTDPKPPVIRIRRINPAFDQALIEDKYGPGSKFFEEGLAEAKARKAAREQAEQAAQNPVEPNSDEHNTPT